MSNPSQSHILDAAMEAAKGSPAVAGAAVAAITLNEAVAIATGIYVVVQAAYLLRKWWREEQEWASRKKG
jgi:hypothetical protein